MLRKLICQVYCILMKGEPINSGFFGNKVNMFTFIESLLKIQIATKKMYTFYQIFKINKPFFGSITHFLLLSDILDCLIYRNVLVESRVSDPVLAKFGSRMFFFKIISNKYFRYFFVFILFVSNILCKP